MACRSCAKKRANLPRPDNWTLKDESDMTTGQWPLIEYTGNTTTDMLFKGRRTGRSYMFAANSHNRYHRVHPDDVVDLLRFPYFRQIEKVPAARSNKQNRILMSHPVPAEATIVQQTEPAELKTESEVKSEAKLEPESKIEPKAKPEMEFEAKQNEQVAIEEPHFTMPDFDETGNDYEVIESQSGLDISNFTVADILNAQWSIDEIRAIRNQELASSKPRITIVKWAEKKLNKLADTLVEA